LTTTNKDFKVKNGIAVTGSGTFGGPVTVGTPTAPDHAVTKEYLESVLATLSDNVIDSGNIDGDIFIIGGNPYTIEWDKVLDAGSL
jgi:hypothetical protein